MSKKSKKVLTLIVKKKWFDMIESGVKKEEYRDLKPHWHPRLFGRDFDVVVFRNGYRKDASIVAIECLGVTIGRGKIEWGAPPNEDVYIIKLGQILV